MIDTTMPVYDKWREWIRNARAYNETWERIKYARRNDEAGLIEFIKMNVMENFYPEITVQEWYAILELEKNRENDQHQIDIMQEQSVTTNNRENNEIKIPEDPHSSWQLYKMSLLKKGFKEDSIESIENSILHIARNLSTETKKEKPVKGLVVGNVQSGKTANMAGLMAMTADYGWNIFIILSGTIENLRKQTQERLFKDLNNYGTLRWTSLEHVSKKNSPYGQRVQDLHLKAGNLDRYFTVCLKNPGRLKDLIQWLQADKNKMSQMKIIVIDDEADQAGINTADVAKNERSRINGLIRNLVNCKDYRGKDITQKYQAMNYIGYTATPYANILNDSSADEIYPSSFIASLEVPKEYFGPQQIFGLPGKYDGLDIVRIISEEMLDGIKSIHDGLNSSMPVEFEDAICWFLCGVSTMRYWGIRKPVSMLVHTSQKTNHHENISDKIRDWFLFNSIDTIINKCKSVWEKETKQFSKKKFREQYPVYGISDENIKEYPSFAQIQDILIELLNYGVTNIPLGEEGEFSYHKGIHLCIDNCKNNGINEEGMFVRLAYPKSEEMPDTAPAFIVVGGATLSRGLTLEGLISTVFLRSVGQADTLMQMGRWFGYRRGYELLPRIWLTNKTNDQFRFLASLDDELREEIHHMAINGISPSEYGPKVKNTPKYKFIRITSKKRMQSAIASDYDFSGTMSQTFLFENNMDIFKHNIEITKNLVEKLGEEEKHKAINQHAENNHIWRNIDFSIIKDFLLSYKYYKNQASFQDIEALIKWIENVTKEGKLDKWNVVFAGKKSKEKKEPDNTVKFDNVDISKVIRTKKSTSTDEVIDIGALVNPKDVISDVDLDFASEEAKNDIINFDSRHVRDKRNNAGLNSTPLLLLYLIDKDSAPKKETTSRKELDVDEDIVGLSLVIPGGKKGVDYASTISINIDNELFDEEGDLVE